MVNEVLLARGRICNLCYELVIYYDLLHLYVQVNLAISSLVDSLSSYCILVKF